MATESPDFWRKIVNNINGGDLPEDGKDAPEMERKPVRRRRASREGFRRVTVQKLITIVYVMTDLEGHKYTSAAHQNMAILGEMTLEEALKLANEGHTHE
jgi:hypothetical protein